MKRLISILVLIAMLMTSFVIAVVPVFAEESSASGEATDSIATGSTATGNNITPGSLTEQYEAEGGWTAVATWDAFKAALAAGNKKIYLTADIPNATNYNAKTSAEGDQLDGAIIDGNGYTITAAAPLFQHTKNTTFQNLTLNSTFTSTNGGWCALANWATHGYTKIYNVTANVTATYASNSSGSQQFSALVIYAQSGSEFENVVVNATMDMTSASIAKANSVGLLAARAETTTVNNCLTKGSIKVGGTAFNDCDKSYNGVGGLVGQASNVTFEDCTNAATIEVTAPGNSKNRSIGGIAGFSTGTNSYTNCINNGSITVTYTNNAIALTEASGAVADTNAQQTGGLIGYLGTATTITKCENRGNVTLTATASGTMTAADDNATAASYTLKSYAGGVIGYAAAVATFQDVWNSGDVSVTNNIDGITITGAKLTKAHEAYAAGVVGYSSKNFTFNNSATLDYTTKNTGDISSNYYAAGIIGYMTDGGGINRSVNEGNVTATDIAAGIVAFREASNQYDNMNYCSNSGTITLTGKAATTGDGYAAGLVGVGGNNINDSTNTGNIVIDKNATNHANAVYAAGIQAQTGRASATIQRCTNTGSVTVSGDIKNTSNGALGTRTGAGIVANVAHAITVSNCTNEGSISSKNTAGIAAYIGAGTTTISNCSNSGDVTGNVNGAGMVAEAKAATTVDGCTNTGTIYDAYRAAGIVARNNGNVALTVTNCVNGDANDPSKGAISVGDKSDAYSGAGGIVGYTQHTGVTIKSSVNYGTVTNSGNGQDATNGVSGAGGIMGKALTKTAAIGGAGTDACINYGAVNVSNKAVAGGIIGSATVGVGDMITVTVDSNNGSGAQAHIATVVGDVTLLAADTFKPAVGKAFAGWSTATDGAAIDGTTVAVEADTTIHALWKDAEYTITFNGNGAEGTQADATATMGNYKLPDATTFTAPEGKWFKGWATTANGEVVYNYNVTGDTTFYAIWADDASVGATATGNNVTPGSLTAQYEAEEGWIAISSWDDFAAKVVAGGKYYFTTDITATSMLNIQAKLDGTVIDGNGYTLTATQPLFQHTNNTTFQNMTLKSTLTDIAAGATPLAYWENKGYTKVYNVTVESTITVGANTAGSQSFSGFMIFAKSGSELNNVIVDTTLNMTNEGLTKVNSVGVIAAKANGAIFTNCIAKGTVTIGANAFTGSNQSNSGVGGIVGDETAACYFTDCTNEADITVTAPITTNNKSFGGIVGYSDGVALNNCVNKGDVNVTYTKDVAGATANVAEDVYVGGAVGYASAASNLKKVENQGDVTVNVTVSGQMAAEAAATVALNTYASGIVGYAAIAPVFNGILNSGAVSNIGDVSDVTNSVEGIAVTATRKAYAAGVLAFAVQQASFPAVADMVADYNAKNTGAINSNYYAAGIIAYMTWGAGINYCVNEGAVTATDIAAGIIANRADGGQYNNMNFCSNSGTITLTGAASTTGEGYAAGLVGVGGNNINDSTNEGAIIIDKDASNHSAVYAAGIIGKTGRASATIQRCTNTGEVSVSNEILGTNGKALGTRTAAGIVANVQHATTIKNCTNEGEISGKNAAGIAGYINAGTTAVSECSNSGKITGNGNGAGIVAEANAATTVNNCTNTGTIYDPWRAAGIVARNNNNAAVTVTNCVNGDADNASLGSVTAGTSSDAYSGAGGIVGYTQHNGITIKGCTNYGTINNNGNSQDANNGVSGAGGIMGKALTKVAVIGGAGADACINYGAVNVSNKAVAGGIIGSATVGVGDMITVTVDSNNGSNAAVYYATVAGDFTLPADDMFAAADENKVFAGWATSADGEDVGDTYALTENVTFFAVWNDLVEEPNYSTIVRYTVEETYEMVIPATVMIGGQTVDFGVSGCNLKTGTEVKITITSDWVLTGRGGDYGFELLVGAAVEGEFDFDTFAAGATAYGADGEIARFTEDTLFQMGARFTDEAPTVSGSYEGIVTFSGELTA